MRQPIKDVMFNLLHIFCDSPGKVVRDHGSSDCHLLEGKNELGDPDETHGVVPNQVLKRPLHFIFNDACGVVLHWCPCQEIQR